MRLKDLTKCIKLWRYKEIDNILYKQCGQCDEFKNILTEFTIFRNNKDGRYHYCKPCRSLLRRGKAFIKQKTTEYYSTCYECKSKKPLEDFVKSKRNKNGKSTFCKSCSKTRSKLFVKNNREAFLKTSRRVNAEIKKIRKENFENREKIKCIYCETMFTPFKKGHIKCASKECLLKSGRVSDKKRRENGSANYKKRNKIRKSRPKWLTKEMISEIASIYKKCRQIKKETKIPHEVDHIIPLCSPLICGLHVPWNLQILTREENVKKTNKFDPEIK